MITRKYLGYLINYYFDLLVTNSTILINIRSIKLTLGDVVVERILGDFEKAAWQAVRNVFENIELKGCLFHYSQVITHICK